MKHGLNGRKFGRDTKQRKALLRGLATSLILHGRIVTTLPKAKDIKPYVEKLITRAKNKTLHNIRYIDGILYTDDAKKKLFDVIAPKMATRNGGYARIYKYGFRKGDGGARAIIEIIDCFDNNAKLTEEEA
jgi:large subunit ribosomal protein L17